MFNNRNMYISILEINRKSIIILLNKLPYLSDSRHLKSRYVHISVKSLKVCYGSLATVCLQTTNTLEYKPAPPLHGVMSPLVNSLSISWINDMMS